MAWLRLMPYGASGAAGLEAGGRPADETVAFVRSWGLELSPAERSQMIRHAYQQFSTILQTGNAEMILSALG